MLFISGFDQSFFPEKNILLMHFSSGLQLFVCLKWKCFFISGFVSHLISEKKMFSVFGYHQVGCSHLFA